MVKESKTPPQKDSDKIALRVKPPRALLLDKPLLMVLFVVVVALLLWGVFLGFRASKKNAMQTPIAVNTAVDKSASLAQLPSDYQNIKGIARFLRQPSSGGAVSAQLKKELTALRNSQAELRQQLNSLRQKGQGTTSPAMGVVNSQDQRAARSNMFFNQLNDQTNEKSTTIPAKRTALKKGSLTAEAGAKLSGYAEQNMQGQKLDFLKGKSKTGDVYNSHPLLQPLSPNEVQAGAIIPAVLITAVNTSLPGIAIAQVRQNVYDTVTGKILLIPKGSRIIGQYDSQVAYGQTRILIAFDRIIMPNGDSIQLDKFVGAGMMGTSGFDANVNNHWMRILGAATISTILSLGTGAASSGYSSSSYYPSPAQNALTSAAGSISATGQQLTGRAIDVQPTLTIKAGYQFNVMVNKDMILQPYKRKHATL